MTRKDRTEGIYNRREVLDESERRQYCLIQLKDLLSYAYRYSEDVKKRFDRAQFNVEKFKTLSDIKHIPLLKKKELIFLQSIGPRLGGLLTKDIGELKRIFLSPGPIFDPEDRMDDYWGYTEAFYSVGFRPGDVVQVTFNYHLSPAGLMFEEPLRNLGCASIPAGPTDPGTQLDIMQTYYSAGTMLALIVTALLTRKIKDVRFIVVYPVICLVTMIVVLTGKSEPLMIAGAFIIGWAGAGGLLQIATSVCNMLFPKIKGTVTALVMIASSLCNYTILTAASKMQPEQVMVMNIVLTAVGVLLGLFVNIRYAKMVEQAEAEN